MARALLRGKEGNPGRHLVIDCSTISPIGSQNIAAEAKKKNVRMVDAPVGGGVPAAEQGALTLMVGADDEKDYQSALPHLELMGAKIVYCGKNGAGLASKLCNNLIL